MCHVCSSVGMSAVSFVTSTSIHLQTEHFFNNFIKPFKLQFANFLNPTFAMKISLIGLVLFTAGHGALALGRAQSNAEESAETTAAIGFDDLPPEVLGLVAPHLPAAAACRWAQTGRQGRDACNGSTKL